MEREPEIWYREGQRVCNMGVGDRDGERTRDMIERFRECAIWVSFHDLSFSNPIWDKHIGLKQLTRNPSMNVLVKNMIVKILSNHSFRMYRYQIHWQKVP